MRDGRNRKNHYIVEHTMLIYAILVDLLNQTYEKKMSLLNCVIEKETCPFTI